eukprot:scaffold2688_cov157-Amphora_coffeaeformis.AAC.1
MRRGRVSGSSCRDCCEHNSLLTHPVGRRKSPHKTNPRSHLTHRCLSAPTNPTNRLVSNSSKQAAVLDEQTYSRGLGRKNA